MKSRVEIQRQNASEMSLGQSSIEIYTQFIQHLLKEKWHDSILDFGSGKGELTQLLSNSKQFTKIIGVDLMPAPKNISATIEWNQTDLNQPLVLADESVSGIVACEILEHLENPRAVAREWYRLLKTDGKLLMSTPNLLSFRSLISLLIRNQHVAFTDTNYPAHITPLLEIDLIRILTEANFKKIHVFFSNQGALPGLNKVSWQGISASTLKGRRFSDTLFVAAEK